MKYEFLKFKNYYKKFVSALYITATSACALGLVQNCSYGSKVKSRTVPPLSLPYTGKEWGPKMVYIEGGLVVTGGHFGSPFASSVRPSRVVTVSAFYMSETAVTNRDYLKYLDDLIRSGKSEEYKKALPSNTVWESKFVFNDSLKNYPFARVFLDYPAVGLNYKQCEAYCTWLTEKERSIVLSQESQEQKRGYTIVKDNLQPTDNQNKDTSSAVNNPTNTPANTPLDTTSPAAPSATTPENLNTVPNTTSAPSENPQQTQPVAPKQPTMTDDERLAILSRGAPLSKEDKIKLLKRDTPLTDEEVAQAMEMAALNSTHQTYTELAYGERMLRYRLPTEAEFDYATKATQSTQDELGVETTMVGEYGQPDSSVRIKEGIYKGQFVGLFKRGYGDYKGVPGSSPTDAPTEEVRHRPVNALGVSTQGNVWKWTCEVYRQTPADDFSDLNPVRIDDDLDNSYDKSSPMSKTCRVIRGGSYATTHEETRSYMDEEEAANDVGFMIAASVA